VGYTSGVLSLCCGCSVPVIGGCRLCIFAFLLVLLNSVPIATIVIGAVYFDSSYCPAESIALLLVVGGSISLVQGLVESTVRLIGIWRLRHGESATTHNHPVIQITNLILRLSSFGWLIATCVIVYRLYPKVSFDENNADYYCQPILYMFSFWLVTVTLVCMGLIVVLLLCSCCCIMFVKE